MLLQKINTRKSLCIFFIAVSVVAFVLVGIRCATVPFCNDEAATFFYYIQPGDFLPYHSFVSANNHILNSLLSWVCFKLAGDSPFWLRLPNLLALPVLIIAIWRLLRQLTYTHSKLVLIAGFLLSFHWLSFYSVCRGYGLSMSFLVLSISYLSEYFLSGKYIKLLLFYLFLQIAISANLILVITAIPLTFSVMLYQYYHKSLLNKYNIAGLLIHSLLLLYWIRFSFFLQEKNMLYLGDGKSYWNITFVSLIQLLSGTKNRWLPYIILAGSIVLTSIVFTILFRKIKTTVKSIFIPSIFYPLILIIIIAAFYVMKILLHINYPVDRTGLFFYVFFVVSVTFLLDRFSGTPVKVFAGCILAGAMVHFIFAINFTKHSSRAYVTFPERFYIRLLEEQKLNPERITIGGLVQAQFVYDFWNYRNNGALNCIDVPFTLNDDYGIALGSQQQYYHTYYDKIDSEKDWGLALYKRRNKVKRNLLFSANSLKTIHGNDEYYYLYEAKDTAFMGAGPLVAEFTIGTVKGKMPAQLQLVLEIDSTEGQAFCNNYIPLNWIRYDWSADSGQKIYSVSSLFPSKIHRLAFYLRNPEKKEFDMRINSLKIYQSAGIK
ncbi:MAG TPA: hypothetical protein VK808_10210 [Bacteroidia bacterium]|nr:hypothetical protein [Bacteroidia bacterium]